MRIITAILVLAYAQGIPAQTTFHGDNTRTGVFDASGPRELHGTSWLFKTDGPIVSSPALSNGVVFFGSSDGVFYAVDRETGKQKWKSVMTDPISSSPAVFNGRVYFGSSDGHVYALDAQTGVLAWSFQTGDVVHASPAIANSTVYIGSWDSYLYALDAATGLEKWRFKAGDDPVLHNQVGFQSSAAIANGVVYVGCRDGHVYAIDAATGRKRWDYSTSQSWVNGTPAVRDGVVYVGTSDTHRFHALDAKTGRLLFVVDTQSLIFGSAARSGNLAYVGAFNGRLSAFDIKAGKLAWQFQTEAAKLDALKVLAADSAIDSAAVAPLFHNFLDMTLYLYKAFSVGAIASSPVIDHGTIFFGSADGNLYAIQ